MITEGENSKPQGRSQYNYWDEKSRRRSSMHPAVRAFAQPKLELIASSLDTNGDNLSRMTALEVGSGSGHLTVWAKCLVKSLIASDYSINMLRMNPVSPRLCCDASVLPFKDNSFDCVLCMNLLHHVSTPITFVKEMSRVSKQYVVLGEPNRNNPLMCVFGLLKGSDRGLLKITSKWLRSLTRKCGLSEVSLASQGFVLPNVTPVSLVKPLCVVERWLAPHFYLIFVGIKSG